MVRIVCANPLLDLIYFSPQHSVKNRHFFNQLLISAGGFGPNVARALKCLDEEPECYMLTGGDSGRVLRDALESERIEFKNHKIKDSSRVATQWLKGRSTKMLVSPSPMIDSRALKNLFEPIADSSNLGEWLMIGGSVTEEVEAEYVERIVELCLRTERCCCDVRTSRWRELLSGRPFILKLPGAPAGRCSEKDAVALLDEAAEAGVHLALCSTGPTSLLARTAKKLYKVSSPGVKVINPYGAGDCLIATLAASLCSGKSIPAALRAAVCAAAASVRTPIPGHFEIQEAYRLASRISLEAKSQ